MSATYKIEILDTPEEKRRASKQMQMMQRAPDAGLACVLFSWLYFGYQFWCIKSAQLSGYDLLVPSIYMALDVANASVFLTNGSSRCTCSPELSSSARSQPSTSSRGKR